MEKISSSVGQRCSRLQPLLAILFIFIAVFLCPLYAGGLTATDANIIELGLQGIPEPQGITNHPLRQTLFIVAKNPGRVVEIDYSGNRVNTFLVPEIRKPEGITFDPVTGELLICRGNNVIFRATADGTNVSVFLVLAEATDADGIAVHPSRGTLFVTDDDSASIFEFDRTGAVLNRFSTEALVPRLTEPQGIGFFGTDLIVSDDLTDTLYLFSPEGELLQTLLPTASFGIRDPEGVAVIGQERVCTVSDNDNRMLCFSLSQPQMTVPMKLDFSDSFIGVAAVNSSPHQNALNAYGFTREGWQTVFDQVSLPGSGQSARLTREIGCCGLDPLGIDPESQNSTQSIRLVGQRYPIQGFFMAGDFSLNRLDGIGGSLTLSDDAVLPIARQSGSARTIIYIVNPDSTRSTSVSLSLHHTDGSQLGQTEFVLPPYGSLNQDLAQLFDENLDLEAGYVLLSATRQVRVAEFLVDDDNLSAINGQAGDTSGTMVAPHFFTGAAIGRTTLSLFNFEEEASTVTVIAFDSQGNTLALTTLEAPGNQLLESDVAELLELDVSELIQGYLVVNHRGPQLSGFAAKSRMAAMVTFENASGQTRSSLALQSAGSELSIFPHVAQARTQGVFQGLAILNWSDQTAAITVQAFDQSGVLQREVELNLGAFKRIVALLDDARLFGADFEQQAGYLRVNSNTNLIAFSLFGGARFLSAIERDTPLASDE